MRRRGLRVSIALLAAVALGGCSNLLGTPPPQAPQAFPGVVGQLGRFGINVSTWTSGDPGCDQPSLSPAAIRFEATGLDQSTPVLLRIYIFGSREAWNRRLADVDSCVGRWATDPSTFVLIQTSPYVVAGQGPWGSGFDDALRQAIEASAGSGD